MFVQISFLVLSKINTFCAFHIYRQRHVRKRGINTDLQPGAGVWVKIGGSPCFPHEAQILNFNFMFNKTLSDAAGVAKEMLTLNETAQYMGVSRSFLYKLTMGRKIPHYKPNGKMIYFDLKDVEEWLRQNRVATADELEARAQAYCANKKGGAL